MALLAGPAPEILEDSAGTAPALDAVAVIEFPDAAATRNWLEDPELPEVHAMRRQAGKSAIYMIGG